ncbi:MAG: FecR domain-containing protein, partial [Zoogloeaceae bacterium]|nr:FecR domain-containing protein [Zoogloeaceae bacterium]
MARALARAAIVLDDDVLVRLDQNSTLTIMPPAQRADSELGLREGALHVISRFRKRFGVQTPFVNALVDGTEFTVIQDSVQGRVVVAEGRVRVHNRAGELLLLAGQSAAAGEAGAPSPIEVRPIDAIRWAIHYPPVIRLSDAQLGALAPALAARARSALALDVDGQTTAALDALGDGEALREVAALRALRASMLLSVGRVDQARPLLENVPAGADGAALHALRAIVRLTENAFGEAKEEAMSAVTADRDLAAGWIALSYARQAERDPQGALEAAAAACLAAPGDALAWARRAELALALSRIEEGRQHAARAVSLEPRVPRGNALLGFAQLLAGDLQAASARFDDALRIDANEPLAHLGRGLALIRAGSLAPGRRELEIAVILDPSNAELRSTLGRAYLEEARGKVASDQFELAKRLDPASPTPWYYGAFGKLRANDPIGAIADGQRAIELNDNRAVLRSDSLLDSDRAARNADLGRAYQQLGFEASLAQAARDSLADDPANSAAHRLMADAYGEQNGFESARLSELLQARLRAPLGGRPLDAYRLVPALPVLDGPRALSPEETSALFATGAHHFSASVLAGSQDTRGLSFTASSASEKAQVSASAYDLRSDGFGEAADVAISGQKLDVQLATSPSTAILAELSHSDRSGSNFSQRLFADAGDPDRSSLIRRDEGRLSLRHAPSTDEEWIVSANVAKVDAAKVATSTFPGGLVVTTDDTRDVDLHELAVHYSKMAGIAWWQVGVNAYRADDRGQSGFACCSAGDPLEPD